MAVLVEIKAIPMPTTKNAAFKNHAKNISCDKKHLYGIVLVNIVIKPGKHYRWPFFSNHQKLKFGLPHTLTMVASLSTASSLAPDGRPCHMACTTLGKSCPPSLVRMEYQEASLYVVGSSKPYPTYCPNSIMAPLQPPNNKVLHGHDFRPQ